MVLVSIDYYPELDVVGGTAPLKVGKTEFKFLGPANRRNEVDSQEWEKIKKIPAISMRLDKGILRLVGGGQPIMAQQFQQVVTPISPPLTPEPIPAPLTQPITQPTPVPIEPPPPPAPTPQALTIQEVLATSEPTSAPVPEKETRKKRGSTSDSETPHT